MKPIGSTLDGIPCVFEKKIVTNGLIVSHFESVELVLTSFILSYLLVLHCLTKVDCPVLQPLFLRNAPFKNLDVVSRGYKTFFKLSSAEHDILAAHKC